MKNLVIILICLLAIPLKGVAEEKSDKIKPQWLHSLPKPSNNSFIYSIKTGEGLTLEDARHDCLNNLLEDAGLSKGLSVTSDYSSSRNVHKETHNGQTKTDRKKDFRVSTTVKGKEVNLQGVTIDEYWQRNDDGKFYLTTLFSRSQLDKTPHFDNVELTTKYGVNGLWRSAIVPGWGQLYKGSTLKGGLILGGTVAFVGGIIYTETMRKDYMNKINKTHNTDNIRTYKTRADNLAMGRNICIVGLSALYVYNIVDAIVAPGARRIITKKNSSGKGYSFTPAPTSDGGLGIYAEYTF
ncbi:MAG: hypothetical protein K2G67_01420 [Muribaculaceae bacterium]|nr:hypothetical protein [Muribaculaceae bacterium]